MRRFGIIVWFLFCCFTAWSQPATLKGVVVESNSKGEIEPIAGALVYWLGQTKPAVTDSLGVFYIPIVANKNSLVVQAMGFKTDTILVNNKNTLRVMMISKRNFEDAIVSYERKSTEVSFIDPWKVTIMNEKELFKAACCNLSESFETNPSVDVAFNDALTGSKQIQMLGLAGQYTQMSVEQLPGIRGIASNYGLNYIPGTWINAIQVSKGTGSVVNGFESISGQINVELHKPTTAEKIYFNAYGSEGGRYEANLVLAQQPTKRFSHALFLHASTYSLRMDQNKDSYLDNPLGEQINALYRVLYDTKTGFVLNASVQYVKDKKWGGEFNYEEAKRFDTAMPLYGTLVDAERLNGTLKMGYLFAGNKYRSMGLQLNANRQTFDNYFGKNIYQGTQNSTYANFIFQDKIGNPNHRYRIGLSSQTDNVSEHLFNKTHYHFHRNEWVAGAFAEYTFTYMATFTAVLGSRIDHHNLFGWQYTPRIHLRYAPWSTTVIRAAAGKGWRTANLLAENMGSLISNRTWRFTQAFSTNNAYGFGPEVAYNFGLNLNHEFKLNYRNGSIGVDYYHTYFDKQVVVDKDKSAQEISFYALDGKSYSRSLQIQLDYQPIRRFDVRFAYRWYEVITQYEQALRSVPMIAKHRWFLNLGYTTKSKWNFDVTSNWTGQKRLPITTANPIELRLNDNSTAFWLWNAQVTKSFKKYLSVYVGVENIFNFQQPNAILDGPNPFGNYFDASLIWGPIFGRMAYVGLRLKI